MFAWNGKYFKLPMVNLWPRPIQSPYPPVWVPGSGSLSTWDFSAKHDHCYCFLSYYGNNTGKRIMDGFWEFVQRSGLEPNPYRAGFLQLVAVSETDAKAEEEYSPAHPLLLRQVSPYRARIAGDSGASGLSQPGPQREEP